VVDVRGRTPPTDGLAGIRLEQLHDPDRRDHQRDEPPEARLLLPVPGAAAVDDVLFARPLLLDPEEARPRDDAAHRDVEQAPKGDDDHEGRDERPADAPALLLVEEDEDRGAGKDGNSRRDADQSPPLIREELRFLSARGETSGQRLIDGCHRRSLVS
jgi:hypothetical protein